MVADGRTLVLDPVFELRAERLDRADDRPAGRIAKAAVGAPVDL